MKREQLDHDNERKQLIQLRGKDEVRANELIFNTMAGLTGNKNNNKGK